MTEHFTFREEVLDKYDEDNELYEFFMESFDAMPVSADVNGDYLCMHGGVSPDLQRLSDINKINRFREPPLDGFFTDLLWSDPCEDKDAKRVQFKHNRARECSFYFGSDPVKKIIKENYLVSIVRAHQVKLEGYQMHHWGAKGAFPEVVTIFSAPNYCSH